jgi:multidrug resistance efflux pump
LRALREETAVEEQALARDVDSARAAHEEAKARLREAEVRAEFAGQDVVRLRGLKEEGLIPRRDFDEGTAEAESLRAGAESLNLALTRLDREQKTRESDRKARLKRLQSEISNIEGQKINTQAVIASLKYEIEKHMVRAPVDGRLGEVATLRVGAVVREGEKLGAIIPGGRLRVVADFSPAAVFGRVHTGQPGRLRLDGFPWAQYGSISATVIQVASEIREGRVRVELSLDSKDSCTIPKQHGLPGVVEVQVEKVTPATLALRSAGRLIASPRAAVEVAQK